MSQCVIDYDTVYRDYDTVYRDYDTVYREHNAVYWDLGLLTVTRLRLFSGAAFVGKISRGLQQELTQFLELEYRVNFVSTRCA